MGIVRHGAAALAAIAVLSCAAPACAQSYPAKPVRMIVTFSPGSGSDTIARIVAGGMAQPMGQQIIVDNRAGAAGNIGAEQAAKAPPDGYTLFQLTMAHAANAILYEKKLNYDAVRDFAPVTQLASAPSLVVVHPSLPVKTIGELVRLAKARPGAVQYASGGIGTPTFVAGELFKMQAGVDLMHVPYKSGGEAIVGVLTGEVPVYFSPMATALPLVQQGRLRALAVTTPKRLAVIPQSPTVAESGYPGYQAGNWYGLAVPVKTPKEIIATVRAAAVKALADPSVAKRMTELGYVTIADQPEEFAAHIRAEIASLAKVLKGLPAGG